MKLSEGARLVFHTRPADVVQECYGSQYKHVVWVGSQHGNRLTEWCFEILVQHYPNVWGMELRMHQWCGWSSFEQAPEVFVELAKLDDEMNASIFDVMAALEKAGAVRKEEE